MLTTLCLTPLLLFGVAMTSNIVVSLFLYGLWNACYSLTIINGISLRQLVTPDHYVILPAPFSYTFYCVYLESTSTRFIYM
jgi:hypothetical protein